MQRPMERPMEECSTDDLIARVEAMKVVKTAGEQVDRILRGVE